MLAGIEPRVENLPGASAGAGADGGDCLSGLAGLAGGVRNHAAFVVTFAVVALRGGYGPFFHAAGGDFPLLVRLIGGVAS